MRELILVGSGGFIGAVLRYLASGMVNRLYPLLSFPYGTLVVNVVGCLLIGFLSGLAASRGTIGPQTRLFLLVGILGSFTTFSTFGYETISLIDSSERLSAVLYVLVSVFMGIVAVMVGQWMSRVI
ncbi:MAG TPA: fluoride efflux transporter CrcB [Candidatus Latescibacteria bacterium]|nr:fluoride efflux transporter CrcB [Candidatus Latescibacterota bacterium]